MKKKSLLFAALIMAISLMGCQNASNTDVNNTQQDMSTETQNQSETEHYEYEHKADLSHDGEDESIKVTVEYASEDSIPTIKLQVSSADKVIYEEEVLLNYALGSESYLVSHGGKAYLMNYKPLVDHEMATVEFEVFSLDADGNKVVFDNGKMVASLLDITSMDIASWVAFADRENQYFEDAYLLVSTCEGELEYSDSKNKKVYTETFAWLLNGAKGESAEDNLKAFIEETKNMTGALSQEKLDWFEMAFFNSEENRISNMFLTSEYESVADINLGNLFYGGVNGLGSGASEDEVKLLSDRYDAMVELDVSKVTVGEMNTVLQKYAGLALEETNKVGLDSLYYLEEYSAYYNVAGDTVYMKCDILAGWTNEDGTITLQYTDALSSIGGTFEVTLKEVDGGYKFISNKCVE